MNSLDSPLEALAFNYVNYGILAVVNNLWTWVAVVTAAVSFWRIRAIGGGGGGGATSFSVEVESRSLSLDQIGSISEPAYFSDSRNNSESQSTAALVKETATETVVWSPLTCNDGVTKGKFTVHYFEDGDGERNTDGDGDGELTITAVSGARDGELDGSGEWWERWERVVKMRNGDDGWYRYVDSTVINGNVVRLWDDENGGRLNHSARCGVVVRCI